MKMKSDDIVYYINVEDIQTVAEDVCGRRLTDDKLRKIADIIADHIPWFDCIEAAIHATLHVKPR